MSDQSTDELRVNQVSTSTAPLTAEQFVAREQEYLWDDFDRAIRYAANGVWSMAASNYAGRIVWAARVAGVTPHGQVAWRLVAGGVYAELCDVAGLPYVLPDDAEWERLDALMADYGGGRKVVLPQMAATRDALRADAEWMTGDFH